MPLLWGGVDTSAAGLAIIPGARVGLMN
jgi:hypothetical protein